MALWGVISFLRLPIDAIPDITNNQVQVLTVCPTLATQEVEQFVTAPIEYSVKSISGVKELRSISRFGLSVVTVVFEESVDMYLARQLINERLKQAEAMIPAGFGTPELAPIATGLGEILHYRVAAKKGYENRYSSSELRTIQDWIVKKHLIGVPGVVEVNSFGGHLKQYEIAINPEKLQAYGISLHDVYQAASNANENSGGAYIEKGHHLYFIRSEGLARNLEDIRQIVVANRNGTPILVRDLAEVRLGNALRYGAVSQNAQGEVVLGIVMMLKGENASAVIGRVKERLKLVKKSLPEGIEITTFLDRQKLVDRTISTVEKNLIEGALIVILVLVLLVGNFRAGLIIASVIPLSMLFAIACMQLTGVTANLMSLGAIDFGLIVDGSVIIVEATLYFLHHQLKIGDTGKQPSVLDQKAMDNKVYEAASGIIRASLFGVLIILIVYLPILSLTGVEGKMFKPMAETVSFALVGALLLSLTYVPVITALGLSKKISTEHSFADRLLTNLQRAYSKLLEVFIIWKHWMLALTLVVFFSSIWLFTTLGGEFIPTLDEGDIMMHGFLKPGTSLAQTLESHRLAQKVILDNFPNEVEQVISKIGSAEIPTDPMAIETADNIILLKAKEEWTKASTKEELVDLIAQKVQDVPGMAFEFTQPIKMRFDEMMTGVRADVAVKIFGENLDSLSHLATHVESILKNIQGLADLKVEQTEGLPQITIQYQYDRLAQYGLSVKTANAAVRMAFAGEPAGQIFEDEKRFDLVVRMDTIYRKDLTQVQLLPLHNDKGQVIRLSDIALVNYQPGAAQISRDNAARRIVITANARGRDVASLIQDVQMKLEKNLLLPPGYSITYGGQFENLQAAQQRLSIAVPVALILILALLYISFRSIAESLLIFTTIPMSAVGGVLALWFRDMPFSISAGVGFIALFGVAVLNGIVLIAYFNQLEKLGVSNVLERVRRGTSVRIRPVLMTAAVASLGFLPMALSHGAGAEVQRPLATVVIGGLLTSTLLTLFILPLLYLVFWSGKTKLPIRTVALIVLFAGAGSQAQAQIPISEEEAIQRLITTHPALKASALETKYYEQLSQAKPVWDPVELFQYNSADPDLGMFGTNTLGGIQRFPNPGVTLAQKNLDRQLAVEARLKGLNTRQELIKEVRTLFRHLSFLSEQKLLMLQLDSFYKKMTDVAQLRWKSGEGDAITARVMEDQWKRVQVQLQSIHHESAFDQLILARLLESREPLVPQAVPLQRLEYSMKDTNLLRQSPAVLLAQALVGVTQSNLALEKNKQGPIWYAGLNAQYLANNKLFPGYQLGVMVPLIRKGRQQRLELAQLGINKASADADKMLLDQQVALGHQLHALEKYELELDYFKDFGDSLAKDLVSNAQKNYLAGESGRTDFLMETDKALRIRLDYLNSLYNYHLTIIEIKALLGE